MSKPKDGSGGGGGSKPTSNRIRTSDDLDLLRLILEEDQYLKARVIRLIERNLGLEPGAAVREDSKKKK